MANNRKRDNEWLCRLEMLQKRSLMIWAYKNVGDESQLFLGTFPKSTQSMVRPRHATSIKESPLCHANVKRRSPVYFRGKISLRPNVMTPLCGHLNKCKQPTHRSVVIASLFFSPASSTFFAQLFRVSFFYNRKCFNCSASVQWNSVWSSDRKWKMTFSSET